MGNICKGPSDNEVLVTGQRVVQDEMVLSYDEKPQANQKDIRGGAISDAIQDKVFSGGVMCPMKHFLKARTEPKNRLVKARVKVVTRNLECC